MQQVASAPRTGSRRLSLERLLPGTGAAFSLVLAAALVGLFAGGAEPNDPFKSVARTMTGEGPGLLVRYQFQLAAGGLFVVFLSRLVSVLASAEGARPALSRLALASGVIGITLVTLTNAINAALATSVAQQSGDGAVWAIFQAGQAIFTFASMFLGIFLLSASEVIRRTSVLPRWLGYLGLVAGAAYVAGSFSVADQRGPLALPALLGFVLLIGWCFVISVLMIVRSEERNTSRE